MEANIDADEVSEFLEEHREHTRRRRGPSKETVILGLAILSAEHARQKGVSREDFLQACEGAWTMSETSDE